MGLLNSQRIRFHISIPIDVLEFLDLLETKTGKNRSELIVDALKESHRELFDQFQRPAKTPIFRRN